MGLLNSILRERVSSIELNCNTILERDLFDDKLGILDIRAKINNSIDCEIEMQLVDQKNIEKRIVFYLSKMYTQNIRKGNNYNEMNKCISILFTDFEIREFKDIHKYITKWNLREEKYMNVILTDAIEIYIIELPKVKEYKENTNLDTWVKFISDSGDVDMKKADEPIKKAKEVLEKISEDEHERYLAHLRLKYILDQKNIEETGFERGLEQGLERGLKQGLEQGKTEIAKKLKKEKVDIEIIIKATGLTKEEIEEL